MIYTKVFYFNELRVCCYVLWDETKEAVLVDPGCYSFSEQERLVMFVATENLRPICLVNTHAHFDHVMGNAFVCNEWRIKTYIHPSEQSLLEHAHKYCQLFGMEIEKPPVDTFPLSEAEILSFGFSTLQVIETPGHSPGGICLYAPDGGFLITGDTLFAGSIGRTDLPGGDYDRLIGSIKTKLLPLDDAIRVLPGHGSESTLGYERNHNPFLSPHQGVPYL